MLKRKASSTISSRLSSSSLTSYIKSRTSLLNSSLLITSSSSSITSIKNTININNNINNSYCTSARIVEVGLRDGLQNEKNLINIDIKIELLKKLMNAGIKTIEAGSFVSPKWVPQMADTSRVYEYINDQIKNKLNINSNDFETIKFAALTPNLQGLDEALKYNVKEIAVFGAASNTFSMKNINCSISESLDRFKNVCDKAKNHNILIRGYVSCVLGCPYEGYISPEKVLYVTKKLFELGCYEVSLGDTIGVGTPGSTRKLLEFLLKKENNLDVNKLAVHFHDTYGQALANILVALELGISVIDSSISGLGGCPYASGASGNVATEDVVYMLNGLGIETGINMDKLLDASNYIDEALGQRKSNSKVANAKKKKTINNNNIIHMTTK